MRPAVPSVSSPFRNPVWLRLGAGVLALGWLVSCQIDKLLQNVGASDPLPARLEFTPPARATAVEPLSPAVLVSAVDSRCTAGATFHSAVTFVQHDHPSC